MASTTTQRQALLSAVAALPTADDGSWSVPAPILKATSTSEADAKRHVLSFSAWAQGAVRQLPEASEHEATDFSDYYKIVMSRVQLVYAKATQPAGELRFPACRFQTQLRRRPQVVKDGAARELGVFDSGAGPEMVGSYEGSSAAFRAALQAVGERRFRAATLRRLFAARGPPAASIEESLAPVSEEWVRLLSGSRLFELLDDGVGFSASGGVQVRVELQGGQAVVLAQGPWFRVTFAETPILQCMAQFMTEAVQTEGDHGAARWCRDALMNFAVAAHSVQERVHAPGLGSVSFFAGRRAPHADFHLLQHLYLQQLWPAFATSSLFAGRVLPRCRLVGTSAHEGPMALMALEAPLDARLPLSSVLWTVLFWACTGNRTLLPDAFGSATFKHMLLELGLLPDVAMARQDSGRLARFAAIFPETRRMASEIEEFADIEEALRCGYRYFGAGGFFGEKRRGLAEFSIAAKITTALCPAADGTLRVGHAGKLGDFSEGSWADFSEEKHGGTARAKFIVPAEVDRDEMFARLLGYARAGDALHDAATAAAAAGVGAAPGTLLVRADADALAARLREVGGAEAMGGYARIRDALTTYAERVDAAAAALPAQPQAAAASR